MRRNNTFRWIIIIGAIVLSIYFLYPTYKFQNLTPEEREELEQKGKLVDLANRAIKRGLDLQGGMRLTLEVNLYEMVENLATHKDDVFYNLLDETRELTKTSDEDFFDIFKRLADEKGLNLNRYFRSESRGTQDVIEYLKGEREKAVTRIVQILRNRIDQYGVSEPGIQPQGKKRITVELPGMQEISSARELIGKTAVLEFKLVKEPEVVNQVYDDINKVLVAKRRNLPVDSLIKDETERRPEDTTKVAQQDTTKPESKPSTDTEVSISELFGEKQVEEPIITQKDTADTVSESDILVDKNIFSERPFDALCRNLIDYGGEFGVPGQNVNAVKRILEMEDVQEVIPRDSEFLWKFEPEVIQGQEMHELFLVKKEPELTGEVVTDARASINQSLDPSVAGKPEVTMAMDRKGSKIWSRVTGANIGRRLAIVLDNKVYSAPYIKQKIPTGHSSITGMDNMNEAKLLSIILRAGALPASVDIIEQRSVGPSLGEDSIRKGSLSALIGLVIIMVFMILYYRMSGLIANLALVLDIIFLMAIMAGFHATLTLPGIAGIVLTIGMAIDANVLIFERIREELHTGKTIRAAIDNGYARAFTTIFDANLTTLIIALVLYQFGTGPVKGFAVTLSVGIICSMFTAIVVTRVIYDFITNRWVLKRLSI